MLKNYAATLDQLIDETIPSDIRLKSDLEPAMTEYEFENHIQKLGNKNKVFQSYIGLGYNAAIIPAVIQRNILKTRMVHRHNRTKPKLSFRSNIKFQTMVIELTGMEIANSYWMKVPLLLKQWLLDVNLRSKENTNSFSEEILPQTLSVLHVPHH
jgi:glycine dehydrogenase